MKNLFSAPMALAILAFSPVALADMNLDEILIPQYEADNYTQPEYHVVPQNLNQSPEGYSVPAVIAPIVEPKKKKAKLIDNTVNKTQSSAVYNSPERNNGYKSTAVFNANNEASDYYQTKASNSSVVNASDAKAAYQTQASVTASFNASNGNQTTADLPTTGKKIKKPKVAATGATGSYLDYITEMTGGYRLYTGNPSVAGTASAEPITRQSEEYSSTLVARLRQLAAKMKAARINAVNGQ